jgi:hypothetical protein
LTSAPDDEWSVHAPAALPSGKELLVLTGAGLVEVVKRKFRVKKEEV